MPAVPSCILDPIRDQFLALLPVREDWHPLGCHNPRISDAVVFDRLVQVLVFGCGYERAADAHCSATTLRRRRDEWISDGVMESLRLLALAAYDRMIGLELNRLSADGCITKAPSGGECAGKSPVDRAKLGLKRSQLTDGTGVPLVTEPAPANTRDHTLLPATLDRFTALEQTLGPLPEHPWPAVRLVCGRVGPFSRPSTSARSGPIGRRTGRWGTACARSWRSVITCEAEGSVPSLAGRFHGNFKPDGLPGMEVNETDG